MVAAGQMHVPLRPRQGTVSQPLLEHRRGDPAQHGVPPVGVRRAWGCALAESSPASTAASFMDLLTHCRLTSKSGRCRSFARLDARSGRCSTRSSGTGTSRLLGFVARHLRPEGDDRRVLGEPQVHRPEGQALRDRKPRPEHDPHGHPRRVAGGPAASAWASSAVK